jgi:excisionase family DNA binding protein
VEAIARSGHDMNGDATIDAMIETLAAAVASKIRIEAVSRADGKIQPRLLTVDQAAEYLGRTKAAVQHMVAARRLPLVRDGRRIFLDVRELDRWIEQNTEKAEF